MPVSRLRIGTPVAVLAAGALAAGCGGGDGGNSASTSAPSDTVGVKATEMKFDLTTGRAPAGKVTFDVDALPGHYEAGMYADFTVG